MKTKLTLSIDKGKIEKAKRYAKKNKTSVSKIVERYFDKILDEQTSLSKAAEPLNDYEIEKTKLSPEIQRMIGILDENKEIDDERYNYLMKKYS